MIKTILIGLKDLKLIFRDRAALMFMLLAPFLLTLGLGFVTGRFSGNSGSGLSDIPVILVNLDKDELGDALVQAFQSDELASLVEPAESDSPEAARRAIDENQAAAAVIIPAGFTASVIPDQAAIARLRQGQVVSDPTVQIEVYTNPSMPTSAGVIKAIVDEFVSRVEAGRISSITAMSGIPGIESMSAAQLESAVRPGFETTAANGNPSSTITLRASDAGRTATEFDPLAYMAPGMALMFLMYTVSYGGRSILAEKSQGTLPRLLVSPTGAAQVLGGKVVGIYLTGVAQVGILILASAILFGVKWGDPLGMVALILAAVFGATGWGMLVTAVARTPGQVSSIGSAIMLIFGILGGSFISLDQLPSAVQWVSRITPNAWGLDGFTTLALGGTLADLGRPIAALLVMGAVLFGAAVFIFSRSNVMKQ